MFVIFMLCRGSSTWAAEIGAEDARAVREVIEAQLDAFAVDDAALAFSFASSSIRKRFGDPDQFMAMVRSSYPMLVQPAATSFLRPKAGDDAVIQAVRVRDQDGRTWRATYLLRQQSDRVWRIDGCAVSVEEGSTEI